MKIRELKSYLKNIAKLIKEDKCKYKEYQRGTLKYDDYYRWRQSIGHQYTDLSSHYRYRHIAYCLLRGRAYEEIERKVREGNAVTWSKVESIMVEYREVEEIRCAEVVHV
jgi:hypothetical protein